jgi:hypothetical protein
MGSICVERGKTIREQEYRIWLVRSWKETNLEGRYRLEENINVISYNKEITEIH